MRNFNTGELIATTLMSVARSFSRLKCFPVCLDCRSYLCERDMLTQLVGRTVNCFTPTLCCFTRTGVPRCQHSALLADVSVVLTSARNGRRFAANADGCWPGPHDTGAKDRIAALAVTSQRTGQCASMGCLDPVAAQHPWRLLQSTTTTSVPGV